MSSRISPDLLKQKVQAALQRCVAPQESTCARLLDIHSCKNQSLAARVPETPFSALCFKFSYGVPVPKMLLCGGVYCCPRAKRHSAMHIFETAISSQYSRKISLSKAVSWSLTRLCRICRGDRSMCTQGKFVMSWSHHLSVFCHEFRYAIKPTPISTTPSIDTYGAD